MESILEAFRQSPILFLPLGILLLIIVLKIKSSRNGDGLQDAWKTQSRELNKPRTVQDLKQNIDVAKKKPKVAGIVMGIIILVAVNLISRCDWDDLEDFFEKDKKVEVEEERDYGNSDGKATTSSVDIESAPGDWDSFKDAFREAIQDEDRETILVLTHPSSVVYNQDDEKIKIGGVEDLSAVRDFEWTFIRSMLNLVSDTEDVTVNGKTFTGHSFGYDQESGKQYVFYFDPAADKWGWGGMIIE